jgi:anti-anti-sigma factor
MAPLTVTATRTPDLVLVELAGELDIQGATVLDDRLRDVLAETEPGLVALDLRRVEFLDSSGLRWIVMADAELRERGRTLAMVRGSESVQRIFTVTRMEERLRFVDDPAELPGGPTA